MIWESIFAMALIDCVIVLAAFYLSHTLFKHYGATQKLGLGGGINLILVALIGTAVFHSIDLVTMFVLPFFTSQEFAMSVMTDLHLNWSWVKEMVVVSAIAGGLSYLIQVLIPKASTSIEKIESTKATLRKELSVRQEVEKALRASHENLEEQVQERTNTLSTTVEKLQNEIIERKQIEKERNEMIKVLNEKNQEMEQLTYTVSHDLKSPLITIQGFIGHLEKDIEKGNAQGIEEDVQHIRSSAERMQQMTNQLLEFFSMRHVATSCEEISLRDLSEEAVSLVSGQLSEKDVQVDSSPDLPVVVADRNRLLVVYQNLIDNAVKFMGNQSKPHIEIGVMQLAEESVY